MLKSMTAYARAQAKKPVGRFVVEIQSVNRKFLEINASIPQELLRFDGEIKKWIGELLHRGQINFRLFVDYTSITPVSVIPNLPLVQQLKKAWDKIANELGIDESFTLDLIKEEKGVLLYTEEFQDEEIFRQGIKEAVDQALSDLIKMKKTEGSHLLDDINKRLDSLKLSIEQIELFAPEATLKYREKLIGKLMEVSPGFIENEERILREICLFAEKIDIAEEVTRFKSHLKQFSDLLNSDSGTIGKTLEFLVQEINRETNTIGSKASHIEVSKLVIEIKSELERIREQIQNVE
jgi:uncharacterized protein (TIGR00255 family)